MAEDKEKICTLLDNCELRNQLNETISEEYRDRFCLKHGDLVVSNGCTYDAINLCGYCNLVGKSNKGATN